MSFLSFFSPFRILMGFIITSFVIYPVIADPTGSFTLVAEFISKLSPFFEGGV
jgi:hypothetical protein